MLRRGRRWLLFDWLCSRGAVQCSAFFGVLHFFCGCGISMGMGVEGESIA